jgi:hypothetical protein
MAPELETCSDTNPPTKLRNSVAIHCISREIKIAVSITDWYDTRLLCAPGL